MLPNLHSLFWFLIVAKNKASLHVSLLIYHVANQLIPDYALLRTITNLFLALAVFFSVDSSLRDQLFPFCQSSINHHKGFFVLLFGEHHPHHPHEILLALSLMDRCVLE